MHVDTLRVNRDVCVQIVEAWRDGYSETLAQRSRLNREEVLAIMKCEQPFRLCMIAARRAGFFT